MTWMEGSKGYLGCWMKLELKHAFRLLAVEKDSL